MLKLYLIRHGMTAGNCLKRYIGTTDEPLCEDGITALKEKHYPVPDLLFVSPLIRCRQTAELLFPGTEQRIIEDLRECDFGDFENKNYLELSGNADYQAWIDSNGTLPFPNGESLKDVRIRCERGLHTVLEECERTGVKTASMVVHGGTIMNLMSEFAVPERSYYEWHVENGAGYLVGVESQDPVKLILIQSV